MKCVLTRSAARDRREGSLPAIRRGTFTDLLERFGMHSEIIAGRRLQMD